LATGLSAKVIQKRDPSKGELCQVES